QAEDGIRDYKVTGVQTCALPIFLRRAAGRARVARAVVVVMEGLVELRSARRAPAVTRDVRRGDRDRGRVRRAVGVGASTRLVSRSEERRVGKGGGGGVWR